MALTELTVTPPQLPQPCAEPPAIELPRDVPFPGTIELSVDATDVVRHIFRARQTIPVTTAGPMTLAYPKWLPGYHSPQAPIELLAGLVLRAGGETLRWERDAVEVHVFRFTVPEGVDSIEAEFQFLSPTASSQGRITVTPEMLNLQWNTVILYPAGHFSRQVQVKAAVTLPEGWRFACALEVESNDGGTTTFKPVSLDVLVDSPMFAGRHFHQMDLDDSGAVRLNIVADHPDLMEMTSEQADALRGLVAQADRLFGSRPFDHYDFMLALSDELGGIGVEHHRCCETGTYPGYFQDWQRNFPRRDVLAHEYTHAWNGKYRRGADSWTPSFLRPIRSSLMWVYEGQTQYWGQVLSTRAGIWTLQQGLDALAHTAATYELRKGRTWRPMSDTTRDPIIASRSPLPWLSWQRSEDYYSEGQLVWLEVDTRIRSLTNDERSLDDFAAAFFGPHDSSAATHTYDFDDVIRELNNVACFDWADFIVKKLESNEPSAPLHGIELGGYRLVYRSFPNSYTAASDASFSAIDLTFSLGLMLTTTGSINEVIWGSPAFEAGIIAGSDIEAVNGIAFSFTEIRRAINAGQSGAPIELLVRTGKRRRTVLVQYTGGERYPHLEAVEGARQRLDEIYAPKG